MGVMRRPARVVVCGLISTYDDDTAWTVDIRPLYANGLTLQGYTPLQFPHALPAALDHLVAWVEDGRLIPWRPNDTAWTRCPERSAACSAARTSARWSSPCRDHHGLPSTGSVTR